MQATTPLHSSEQISQLPQIQTGIEIKQVDYVDEYVKKPIKVVIAFVKTLKFWLMVSGLALVLGSWALWARFKTRLTTDSAFARRVNAIKKAKQGIEDAREHLKAQNSEGFYSALSKTLNNYIADKLYISVGVKTWDILEPLLEKGKVSTKQINDIKELLDRCEIIRFAAGNTDLEQMQQDLAKLQTIISVLR